MLPDSGRAVISASRMAEGLEIKKLREVVLPEFRLGCFVAEDTFESSAFAVCVLLDRPILSTSNKLDLENGENCPKNDVTRFRFVFVVIFVLSFVLEPLMSGNGASSASPKGSNGVDGIGWFSRPTKDFFCSDRFPSPRMFPIVKGRRGLLSSFVACTTAVLTANDDFSICRPRDSVLALVADAYGDAGILSS